MSDFVSNNKVFLIVILATVALLSGGIFLFSKNGTNPQTNTNTVSNNILVPSGAEETGGLLNNIYQPATPSAKVTLVEFGDYQCPACAAYNSAVVEKVLNDFAGKINFVFRDFAFIGAESTRAAEASYCAADQNKYWEFHSYLYSHQGSENTGTFSDTNLISFAKNMGLNEKEFSDCLNSGKYAAKVDSSSNDANLAGVTSTPSFFLDGIKISPLPASYTDFKALIQNAIKTSASSTTN